MKITNIIIIFVVIIVLVGMYAPLKDKIIEARGIKYNNCIEEESYYYRIEGNFISKSKVETIRENSDGIDYRCLKWEEEPSIAKSFFGQELIHKEGFVKTEKSGGEE